MPIVNNISFENSVPGNPNGVGTGFLGSAIPHAFNFLAKDSSLYADDLAFQNLSVLSTPKFTARSSFHKNKIEINNSTGWILDANKATVTFWFKPNAYYSITDWGIGTVDVFRSIVGNRPAVITDTDTDIRGFSFGISRNAIDTDTFNCTLNVNGQIVSSNILAAGIGDFDKWHFAIVTINPAIDYIGFSIFTPSNGEYLNSTNIFDSNDTATPALGDIDVSSAHLYVGGDIYSDKYFDGSISNVTIYNIATESDIAADVEDFFSSIVTYAWRVVRKSEVTEFGAAPTGVIAAFTLEATEGASNPVVKDRNFDHRGFLARGFTGNIAVDYSSDLPPNFTSLVPATPAKSLVFNGEAYLAQRAYRSASVNDFEGQLGSMLDIDYAIEFWFNCTELPTPEKPVQYLMAKFLPNTADVNDIEEGLYIALKYDSTSQNITLEFYNDQGIVGGVLGDRILLTTGANTPTIEVDTWYHVGITCSNPAYLLDSAGTPGFSKSYLFFSKENIGSESYEDFDEIDPVAASGIAASTADDFAVYDLLIGAGYLTDFIALDTQDIDNTATLSVAVPAASLLNFGVDLTAYGVSIGDFIRIVSPDKSQVSNIEITNIAGAVITYDHGVTPIVDLLGVNYIVGTQGTFGADYDTGTYIVRRNYPTVSHEYIGNNFIGKLTELRLWKKARTFNQIKVYRYSQLPVFLPN